MAYQSFQKPQGSNTGSSMGQQAGSAQGGPMAGNQNQATDQGSYGGWSSAGQDMQQGMQQGMGGSDKPLGFAQGTPFMDAFNASQGRGNGGMFGAFGGAMGSFGKNMSPLFSQLMQRMQSGQGNTGIMMPQSQGGFLDAFKNMPPPAQQVRPGIWLRPGENEADFQFGGKYGPTPFAPRNTGIAGGMGIPQMPDFSKFTRPGGMGAGFPGGGPIPGAPPQGPGTPIEMGPAPRTGPDVYNPTTNPTGKTLPYDIPQDNISGGDQLQMSKQLQDMMSGNNMRKMF